MRIKEMSMSERPIEKMVLYGKESLSNSELLAILLRNGTKNCSAITLADKILNKNADGLRNLTDVTLEELMEIEGIGQTKAACIIAAVEIGKRLALS